MSFFFWFSKIIFKVFFLYFLSIALTETFMSCLALPFFPFLVLWVLCAINYTLEHVVIYWVFANICYHEPSAATHSKSTPMITKHTLVPTTPIPPLQISLFHRWAPQLSVWLFMKDIIKCLSICQVLTKATARGIKGPFQTCMTLFLLWNTD